MSKHFSTPVVRYSRIGESSRRSPRKSERPDNACGSSRSSHARIHSRVNLEVFSQSGIQLSNLPSLTTHGLPAAVLTLKVHSEKPGFRRTRSSAGRKSVFSPSHELEHRLKRSLFLHPLNLTNKPIPTSLYLPMPMLKLRALFPPQQ